MKSTGYYEPTEDDYDLQGEVDYNLKKLNDQLQIIDSNNNEDNTREVVKGMINFLVETL